MTQVMVIPVFIPHRGCPHRCCFCNQKVITAGTGGLCPGPRDMASIIRDYLRYKGRRRKVELAFFGGNFLGLPKREILAFLNGAAPWLARGQIQSIRCSTRPDTVTPGILAQVRPLGLNLVELGVQSMDDEVLARSCRGHTAAQTRAAVAALKAAGMKFGVQLMTGLPGDSRKTCLETARQAAEMGPDLARIYPVVVLRGAPLARDFYQGRYRPQTLDEAITRAGEMVGILEGAGVPVVRLGLQAGEGLAKETSLLAGPWHPAFGHLVRSSLMLDRVRASLDNVLGTRTGTVVLAVHPRGESRLRGDRNSNMEILAQAYPRVAFQVRKDPDLALDEVRVS